MLVLGAGVFPNTSRDPKSVCVSSDDCGPRSWDLGLGEVWGAGVAENFRAVMDAVWSVRDGMRRRRSRAAQLVW